MKVSSLLKGGIYEVSFGYNPKMEGYATLMSDIPELCARQIARLTLLDPPQERPPSLAVAREY